MVRPRIEARFLLDPFEPAYLARNVRVGLEERVAAADAELECCRACPRECGVDRTHGQTRACKTGRLARVSSAFPHHGEEDCLRGRAGSGTIFFSLCNLRCVFCQNAEISQEPAGRELDAEAVAALMMALQDHGCHNVNFVTPEHVVPQVIEAIAVAVDLGLRIPIVYNTSAYDSVRSLKLLDGLVDIYMPDFKFWCTDTARRLARAPDYPTHVRDAIREMHRQVGDLRVGPDGVARRGLLVRHLVLPGLGAETEAIVGWLARDVSADTFLNLMDQYRPAHLVGTRARDGSVRYPEVNRRPSLAELRSAREAARREGLRLDGEWP